ncbi:hypothetical protein B0H13DRAFT_1864669 [Mycena leptocephala]|nr:hypothetical protein B0H13DRAFT_1864669 [Mycena leptocephala]
MALCGGVRPLSGAVSAVRRAVRRRGYIKSSFIQAVIHPAPALMVALRSQVFDFLGIHPPLAPIFYTAKYIAASRVQTSRQEMIEELESMSHDCLSMYMRYGDTSAFFTTAFRLMGVVWPDKYLRMAERKAAGTTAMTRHFQPCTHTMYLHASAARPAGASAESVAGGVPGKFESGHVQDRYTVTEKE